MNNQVSASDEGKKVVYADKTIGRVVEVEDGTAYVDPDPSIAETIKSKFGRANAGADSFQLKRELVDEITDDEIRVEM